MNRITERIKIWGIVQGVGFRPFVAKVADRLGMKGQVLNLGGLVEIVVTDRQLQIDNFVDVLAKEKPEPAEIVHIKRTIIALQQFDTFSILESGYGGDGSLMIPADLSICSRCLAEMRDPENPRFSHPFISCMVCGPRYSIIEQVPYDRQNTTMDVFTMCSFCQDEYTNLHDRRYHAQTISCHHCGPMLKYPITEAAELLQAGKVIAFKSTGGYNLICDLKNETAIERLRRIKDREQKPFAVMFSDIEQVKAYCYMNETEETLLKSSARPIILLEHKPSDSREINKSRFIGAFLPSMGAQHLLLDRISPLIVTSANVSSMPMIKDDEEIQAMCKARPEIEMVLSNERKILTQVDDSVVRVIDGQPQMIRRSKGYAPTPLHIESPCKAQILATGGQLKNAFALSKGPFAYMSQYIGDLEGVETQQVYLETLSRMKELFRIEPTKIVCDLHPLYYTTEFALKQSLPVIQVQHHHAHVASVMAEHNLQGKVIGVSFDGTGYGTDGAVWGGEFLLCQGAEYRRMNHLKYVKMVGGDASMKEAWKSAVSYFYAAERGYQSEGIEVDLDEIIRYAAERSWDGESIVRKALELEINTVNSSSMGRLFDAVSAMLGIKDYNEYEGQCAILLEDAAARALDSKDGSAADRLALGFHKKIANMILEQCEEIGETRQVVLTGGVFQNKILMEETLRLLRKHDFEPYYNVSVSPNDGGIALGQLYIAMNLEVHDGN